MSDIYVVTVREEARLTGVDPRTVSRAREDPTHPVHGQDAIRVGDRVRVQASLVSAWWQGRPRGRGRPRTRPSLPPGLTRDQWRGLCTVAAGMAVSPRMVRLLTDGGWLTDGSLTRAAVDALRPSGHAPPA